ncbi:MAG: hypothetical protein Q9209_006145 [Squamulea sp. 1 TL-2023]
MPPKRKQTPDMPQSPPKRVTRARAKKDVDSKPETTRVTTASAKAAASKKNVAGPVKKSTNAATQPNEELNEDSREDVVMEQPVAEPPNTRGKAKATPSTAGKPAATLKIPSGNAPNKATRSRSDKTVPPVSTVEQLPKPRGRAKRNAKPEAPTASETTTEEASEAVEVAPLAKTTRGRLATSAPAKPATTRTRAAAAAPKKRVKFDEQSGQDKENLPIAVVGQKRHETKATGLRAKPIRKPAAAKSGTRATKAAKQGAKADDDTSKADILPLSPKKVTQVAKTPSVGSEDELVGDKTPLRLLTESPSKLPMSVNRNADSTVSQLGFAPTDAPRSPTKGTSPARLATSPRKPPPSPFKDALKASPRKVDLGRNVPPPRFDAPLSPTKSPLKESPKRVNLGDSHMKPVLQWSKTPLKSSLMKSPARRLGSAMKSTSIPSSTKTPAGVPTVDAAKDSKQTDTFKLYSLSAECAASSPLRATKSSGHQYRVYDPLKEQKVIAHASTPTPSPSKEPEVAALHEIPEFEVSEVFSEPQQGLHLVVDKALLTKSPEVRADRNDEPSFTDAENYSGHPIKENGSSFTQQVCVDLHQADNAQHDSGSHPTPMGSSMFTTRPAFVLSSSMIASRVEDPESEDELASPEKQASPSPLKNFGISAKDFGTPVMAAPAEANKSSAQIRRVSFRSTKRDSVAMTPLAMQLSSWLASSPEKKASAQVGYKRGIFSPARPTFSSRNQSSPAALIAGSPAKQSFFEDEMAVRDADDLTSDLEEGSTDELQENKGDEVPDIQVDIQTSFDSEASEIYGDENAVPEDQIFAVEQDLQGHTSTCTPARVFGDNPREIHTVSKVPLRPAADDTPLMVPRKRSKSLNAPLSEICMPDVLSISRDSILSPILHNTNLSMSMLPGEVNTPDTPEILTVGTRRASSTPGRSVRRTGYSTVLKGAVVHVDVHTTEGADASGIFVDLLTQMGARCVKQWHWNPQASGSSPQSNSSPELGNPASKIGITHVVYKDGGKRTLEKVREAKGAVLCVGVSWVLEYVSANPSPLVLLTDYSCEREDKWLEEADYSVDTSIVPRGGSRRRKSMEPRALANLNGNLVPAETPSKVPVSEISPTKEFLTFDTPVSRRDTFELLRQIPATPVAEGEMTNDGIAGEEMDSPLSPTTPYYLSKGAKLVQQTCPPKQTQELFFPLSGRIEDQPDAAVRQRLLMARRKSLQWASKVQSPLGRTVSYGK